MKNSLHTRTFLSILSLTIMGLGCSYAQSNVVIVTIGDEDKQDPAYHLIVCPDIHGDLGDSADGFVSSGLAGPGQGDQYPNDLNPFLGAEQTFIWNAPDAGIYTIYAIDNPITTTSKDTIMEISAVDCGVPEVFDDDGGEGVFSAIQVEANAGQQFLIHLSEWGNDAFETFDLYIVSGAFDPTGGTEPPPTYYDATEDDPRNFTYPVPSP